MEKRELSAVQRRERKFLFVAPVVAMPLLTILFWAGGGGKDARLKRELAGKGVDMELPGVHLPNRKGWTKADYYKQAQQDSLAAAERERSEAGYARRIGLDDDSTEAADAAGATLSARAHVRQVQERVNELSRVLEGAGAAAGMGGASGASGVGGAGSAGALGGVSGADAPGRAPPFPPRRNDEVQDNPAIQRLERIMGLEKKKEEAPDPELAQLNTIMDKLAAVQHPDRPVDSVQVRKTPAREVLAVSPADKEDSAAAGMDALITEEQVLASGERLNMELGQDLQVGRVLIPRGSPVYGQVSLSGERLMLSIRSISYEGKVFPVALRIYDQDGLPGIYIPGLPSAESLKESAGQDLNGLGPELLSPTLASQAAGAGIQAARSLIGRRIRLVHVVVPAGYRLLLTDENKIR